MDCHTSCPAVNRVNVMEDKRDEVHYTFADNLAPYFLLIFSPVFVIVCLFGIFYTYLTTEVRKYLGFYFSHEDKMRLKNTNSSVLQLFIRILSTEVLSISPPQKSKLLTPQERKINVPDTSPFRIHQRIRGADTVKSNMYHPRQV